MSFVVYSSPHMRRTKQAVLDPIGEAWPPKSPYDALLSSPSGRKKAEKRIFARDGSPTPPARRKLDFGPCMALQESPDINDEDVRPEKRARVIGTQTAVNVARSPESPPRREERQSPGRYLLGIDKGRKAQDVSLGRAPRFGVSLTAVPAAGATGRSSSVRSVTDVTALSALKSFSERLNDARVRGQSADEARQQQRSRAHGFGICDEVARLQKATAALQAEPGSDEDGVADFDPFSSLYLSRRSLTPEFVRSTFAGKRIFKIPDILRVVKAPNYDDPDCAEDWILMGTVASKSEPRAHQAQHQPDNRATAGAPDARKSKYMVLGLTDLRWQIDVFLFGASFLRYRGVTVGTLVAILNPTILPPRPAQRDTGKFSLCLSDEQATGQMADSGDVDSSSTSMVARDALLELGLARDLRLCKSTKSDGTACRDWVDRRRSEFCEFHVKLEVSKRQRGRMEVATMPGGPGKRAGVHAGRGRGAGRYGRWEGHALPKDAQPQKTNVRSGGDEVGSYYITPGLGASASQAGRSLGEFSDPRASSYHLLDFEDRPGLGQLGTERGLTAEERSKRALTRIERERSIARRLSERSKSVGDGGGVGGAYLRYLGAGAGAGSGATGVERHRLDEKLDKDERREKEERDSRLAERVKALTRVAGENGTADGVAGGVVADGIRPAAAQVRLSLVRRQGDSSVGETSPTRDAGGEGLARGLKGVAAKRKKRQKGITRFLTSTGIKEAGQDLSGLSGAGGPLGTDTEPKSMVEDHHAEDEDELEIV